jgi:hypothetical protein
VIYATQMPHIMGNRGLEPKHPDLADPTSILRVNMERQYGSLIWVLAPNEAPWSPGVMEKLRDGVKGFSHEDYLLCLGNPILLSMMAVFAAEVVCSDPKSPRYQLRYLQWSRYDGYKPLTVEL